MPSEVPRASHYTLIYRSGLPSLLFWDEVAMGRVCKVAHLLKSYESCWRDRSKLGVVFVKSLRAASRVCEPVRSLKAGSHVGKIAQS